MTTGLVWDERFFWYDFGDYRSLLGGHPWLQPGSFAETAESKRRILNLLHASGLMDALTTLTPVAVDERELCCFHTEDYVRRVQSLSAAGGGTVSSGAPVPAGGYELAALAAGGTRTAIDAVLRSTLDMKRSVVMLSWRQRISIDAMARKSLSTGSKSSHFLTFEFTHYWPGRR